MGRSDDLKIVKVHLRHRTFGFSSGPPIAAYLHKMVAQIREFPFLPSKEGRSRNDNIMMHYL